MTMKNRITLTTPEEQAKLLSRDGVSSYNIFIHDPDGEWVYNWGEIFCNSGPTYDMFRDFLQDSELRDHLESLDHDCFGRTPSPSEFVHAMTFPQCIEFRDAILLSN